MRQVQVSNQVYETVQKALYEASKLGSGTRMVMLFVDDYEQLMTAWHQATTREDA